MPAPQTQMIIKEKKCIEKKYKLSAPKRSKQQFERLKFET